MCEYVSLDINTGLGIGLGLGPDDEAFQSSCTLFDHVRFLEKLASPLDPMDVPISAL